MAAIPAILRRISVRFQGLTAVISSPNVTQPRRYKSWDKYLEEDLWERPKDAKSFAEIRSEDAVKKRDPTIHEVVDISLPSTVRPLKRRSERHKLLDQIRKNKQLEQLARLRKLQIPLEEVVKDWHKESWPEHMKSTTEHYGIYSDLFGHAYFLPKVPLEVVYDFDEELVTPVYRGNTIPPAEARTPPMVSYDAAEDSLWTLALTCPDEHLLEQDKEYLHWLIGNIPGNDLSKGDILCDYLPPIPPKGTGHHRYVFILYRQDKPVDYAKERRQNNSTSLAERTFSTYEFYKEHQDNITPAGLAFYQSEWDGSVRDTFHNTLDMKEPVFEYDYPPDFHPEQVRFPHRKPFNRYLDRYRDSKEIAEGVLKERLKIISPFEDYPDKPKYPHAIRIHDKPTWWKLEEKHRRNREGKYRDLP